MLDALIRFLEMGGYARFVWPAFAAAALTLAVMLVASLHTYRRNRRTLDRLRRGRP